MVDPVEHVALVEQGCGGGVEVLRPVLVAGVGVPSGDEPDDGVVGADGEDEAVAEPVDESSGAGAGDQSDGEHLLIANTPGSQVGDEVGPPGWGVSGAGRGLVGAEPVAQVVPAPGRVQALGVVVASHVVDVRGTLWGERCVVPFGGVGDHRLDLGRGGFEDAHAGSAEGCGVQRGVHVVERLGRVSGSAGLRFAAAVPSMPGVVGGSHSRSSSWSSGGGGACRRRGWGR
jgi:hypothetical protein